MKILLVYPMSPDTFWSFKHVLKIINKKATYPPLGLLTVASLLPEEWEKRLVDENVRELLDEDILWADMVFISAMLVQKDSAQRIINKCNKLGKKVIVGGPAFTTSHTEFKGVDHFILNEAEVTLPLFIKDLKKGKPKRLYSSMKRPDISKTPTPMWSLINMNDYVNINIQYSRGCPFNCEFCDIVIMNGKIPRTKSPEQMVHELQEVYDAGWKGNVFIVDDNFIGNKNEVKKMLPSVIDWQKKHDYPFNLITEASTNIVDDEELMNLMIKANFKNVFLGIETTNIKSLKECGKFQNTCRDLLQSINLLHSKGLEVMGGFIVGFDNDTEDIFDDQIRFIQESGIVVAMVGILNALPQTRLWKRLEKEGRLLKKSTGDNTDAHINFVPKMGVEKLINGYKKLVSSIYSPKNYYERINTFINNFNPKNLNTKISFDRILIFIKSLWVIGVLSKARFYYWKLLIKTLFTNIKALPTVVEFAIKGLHFEKITNKIIND